MKIGYDAKRAFLNRSGLGNYSRLIIDTVSKFKNEADHVVAFTPKVVQGGYQLAKNQIITPSSFWKYFSSFWRSKGIVKDIKRNSIDVFHGLSNELPIGIKEVEKLKTIVTIHDLIFLRFPELYSAYDRSIYLKKTTYAVTNADIVIAISEQTKQDLIDFLNVPTDKIRVIYQDCAAIFRDNISEIVKKEVRKKHHLPEKFVLSVGTIEPRKNQLLVLKAVKELGVSVVFLGRKTAYFEELKRFVVENEMQDSVFFPDKVPFSDFPAIYQSASVFMYPSIFEGFGIPILEALRSKVPVITSKGSCFEETGGDAALYINNNELEAAEMLKKVLTDSNLRTACIEKGILHAEKFSVEKTIPQLLQLYKDIIQ